MNFDFSALNFETIDPRINAYPYMYINLNGVTFTKKVLEDLGYPAYVLCLLDVKAKVFAIRMCKSNEPKGFKFSKPRGEQKGVVTISSKNLLEPLRAATGEDRVPGKRTASAVSGSLMRKRCALISTREFRKISARIPPIAMRNKHRTTWSYKKDEYGLCATDLLQIAPVNKTGIVGKTGYACSG